MSDQERISPYNTNANQADKELKLIKKYKSTLMMANNQKTFGLNILIF